MSLNLAVPDEAPVKKGNRSWDAVNRLDVRNRTPGFRYRHCSVGYQGDDVKMSQRLDQGWTFVNKETGVPGELAMKPDAPGTAGVRRDMVLMALPEELGKERDKHFWNKTDSYERGLKGRLKDRIGERADKLGIVAPDVTGKITIGRPDGDQVQIG